MKQIAHLGMSVLIALSLLLMMACDEDDYTTPIVKPDIIFYGLTSDNQLIQYNGNAPELPIATVLVNGLQSGETILAIDFRPATGQLYGLGSTSRIYSIHLSSGIATAVGSGPFSPAIDGNVVGFDFNPTVDRIRVVTANGQNLRLNPETGAVAATDAELNPGSPSIVGVAYINSFAGAASTTLFDIDITSQKLFKQDPPNDGVLTEIGSLGINPTTGGGFDISPDNKVALACLTVNETNGLYQIDLTTGKAAGLGTFSSAIVGLAIPTDPVAYSIDASNNLLIFNFKRSEPAVVKPVTGLQSNESILGIDMRPATGQLYALGSTSRIYTINMASGVATVIGAAAFTPLLSGTTFGFDFNPTVDRIRIVSDAGQNLRVHPITGAVAFTDTNLNPGSPAVSAAAYNSNVAGATATTLYDIDHSTDKLFKQLPPNDGKLEEVGPLGIDVEANTGFDIGGASGIGYALLTVGSTTKIYSVNLGTGAAIAIADAPSGAKVLAIGLGF
jgi:hypothetical protein